MSDNLSSTEQEVFADPSSSSVNTMAATAKLEAPAEINTKHSKATEANDLADNDETELEDSTPTKKGGAGTAKGRKGVKSTKASPKKRTTEGTDIEDESPKKKRAGSKAKVAVDKAKVADDTSDDKAETSGSPDDTNVKSEVTDDDGIQVPSTPMKGKRNKAVPSTPKSPKTPKTPKSNGATKSKNDSTPRRRAASDKVADKVSLPTSWAGASEADQELVDMKERGESWNDIRKMWREKTGQDTATSTLPNRYKRLQIIMMELDDSEKQLLLDVKAEVEADLKSSKWVLISQKMEEKGTKSKYPVDFLLKEFKKLETDRTAKEGSVLFKAAKEAVNGEEDSDGDVEVDGEE